MTRVNTGRVTSQPYADRQTCANGHPWTHASTRWRLRPGRNVAIRDCLICKRVSEGNRRAQRSLERRYT